MTSPDRFHAAVALHVADRLDEAERLYRSLLESNPEDADVLHRLGVIAAQTGRLEEAERYLGDAVKLAPGHAEAHNNLGNLRQLQDRYADAVVCHRRAIELDPRNAKAHFNLALALTGIGRLDEAAESYLRCLEIAPGLTAAHHNLGLIRQKQGRLDEARESLTAAIGLDPRDAAAHENLGAVLRSQARRVEAAAAFRRALDLDPSRTHLEHLIAAYTGERTEAAPEEYVEHLFDRLATDFDVQLVGGLQYRAPAALKAILFESIEPDRRFRRALDLGCGTGLAGAEIAPIAVELWGVDLSRRMLEQARARGIYHRLDAASIDAFLEAVDATFDLVVAADVFVYIGNLRRTFELVRRRAEDGALFLFSTEIADAGDFVLNPTGRYGHASSYVEGLARDVGFSVLRCARASLRLENEETVKGNCFLLRAE